MKKEPFKIDNCEIVPFKPHVSETLHIGECVKFLGGSHGSVRRIPSFEKLGDQAPSLWEFLNISSVQAKSDNKYGWPICIADLPFELWVCSLRRDRKLAYGCSFREAISAAAYDFSSWINQQ